MNQRTCLVDLRPNRLLLDPSFGGYKLSLDSIPICRKEIESGVYTVQPNDDQFSFYHVKLFSLHNNLYFNPYKVNDVYFVDKNWKIFKVALTALNQLKSFNQVYQISNIHLRRSGNYNISIKFASAEIVVLCNGGGTLYLVKVNHLEESEHWETLHSANYFHDDFNCVLSDARFEAVNKQNNLDVVLLHIEEKDVTEKDAVKSGLFCTVIEWLKFTKRENSWEEISSKQLKIHGGVDYLALEPGCESIYIICDKLPKWTYDSENPIKSENFIYSVKSTERAYKWSQSEDEITIWLPLSSDIEKGDVEVLIDDLQIQIKVRGVLIISGNFFHRVDKDLIVWNYEKNQLEIQLTKFENGLMWKSLILEDDRGEEITDSNLVEKIHNKLSHLCSEKEEWDVQPSLNSQQLEDCDTVTCGTTSLVRVNGKTHMVTHEVSLSSCHWLFQVHCNPILTPAICCRHDVDACVWQFDRTEDDKQTWNHEHIGTFSAFGYVQASKTQKKFVASPPDLSYAAICEASHRIYLYRQPSPVTSELKNRFTGKKISTVSKQQLINLETNEQILGMHATNNVLYLLLENLICIVVVNV